MTPDEQLSARWRVGNRVKLNVYQGDRPAFQCHTPEEAARVVELLNIGESLFTLSVTSRTPIIEINEAFTQLSAIREILPEGDVVEGVRALSTETSGHRRALSAIATAIDPAGDSITPAQILACIISDREARQERDQLREALGRMPCRCDTQYATTCPQCACALRPVTRDDSSPLNSEQFDAVRAGDWFCTNCSGTESNTGYKYWWNRDLQGTIKLCIRCAALNTQAKETKP